MTSSSFARCKALLRWYRATARKLPWRSTRDPYRIWISEIMLQQTQVRTVLPRYGTWFRLFPGIAQLAAASEDEVLKAWQGLGYYRRARLLHQAAQTIVARHNGHFPESFEQIVALPGIGRSTAGAIASICFGIRAPVLDGNVRRVLARWQPATEADGQQWLLAQQLIDRAPEPGEWNQAMMELGAVVCRPRLPVCDDCPVRSFCASTDTKTPPRSSRRRSRIIDVHWRVHLHLERGRGLWLEKRPAEGIWAGLWTPPITELHSPPGSPPDHVHQLSHRRLHLYASFDDVPRSGNGQWVRDAARHAMPTGIVRLLQQRHLLDAAGRWIMEA